MFFVHRFLVKLVYSATRSESKRFRVARFTARDEVECCKRNDESLILPRSSRGSYFPQYTNNNKIKLRPLLSTTSGFFTFSTRSFFRGEYVTSTSFYMQWKLCFSFTYWGKYFPIPNKRFFFRSSKWLKTFFPEPFHLKAFPVCKSIIFPIFPPFFSSHFFPCHFFPSRYMYLNGW